MLHLLLGQSSMIEKLHASFCKKHNIEFTEDVVLSALGVKLRLGETIESYELRDDDEIAVEIENFVDPSAVSVQVRFSDGTTESHHIVPVSVEIFMCFCKVMLTPCVEFMPTERQGGNAPREHRTAAEYESAQRIATP